jgi:hypothetical protein
MFLARSPSDMFRGVLNTKNHPCSRSNMVEMVCFLRWYCNRKYKYRHRRTVGMYKPSSQCFKRTIYFLHCFFSSSLWTTSCQIIIQKIQISPSENATPNFSLICSSWNFWDDHFPFSMLRKSEATVTMRKLRICDI